MSRMIKSPDASTGLARAATLLRALGSKSSAIWSQLRPDEARRLSAAIEGLPEQDTNETQTLSAYIQETERNAETFSNAAQSYVENPVWSAFSTKHATFLAKILQSESPQITAVVLSQLDTVLAARIVQAMPQRFATHTLHRLFHLGEISPAALHTIENMARTWIDRFQTSPSDSRQTHVARIFDRLTQDVDAPILNALETADPNTGQVIKSLMFGFDHLSELGPAGLQTLLMSVERPVLVRALKGAEPNTENAFFNNMTRRAADVLRSEIEALGPVRREDRDAARHSIIEIARSLIDSGEIATSNAADQDLIE